MGITEYDSKKRISTSEKANINPDKCVECGECFEACQFGAIERIRSFTINPLLCEGGGVCQLACHAYAVDLRKIKNGEIRINEKKLGFPLVSGQLYPGEIRFGKIVQELRRMAEEFDHDVMILDSAAVIRCPVIASVTGCDYAILVTEPTQSGFTDIGRIFEIVNHFQIPFGIVLNKWDINPTMSKKIESWSGEHLLGKIPYDRKVVDYIVNLKLVIYSDTRAVKKILNVFEKIKIESREVT